MVDLEKKIPIGDIIKDKRLHVFHLSQEEFADKFGVPVGTLRNWEQNTNQPPAYFMQLLELTESNLEFKYETPIEHMRRQTINERENCTEIKNIAANAKRHIYNDDQQKAVYDIIRNITRENGILENLQKSSSYFDNFTTTDIAAIAQIVLLKDIAHKLDILIDAVKNA